MMIFEIYFVQLLYDSSVNELQRPPKLATFSTQLFFKAVESISLCLVKTKLIHAFSNIHNDSTKSVFDISIHCKIPPWKLFIIRNCWYFPYERFFMIACCFFFGIFKVRIEMCTFMQMLY